MSLVQMNLFQISMEWIHSSTKEVPSRQAEDAWKGPYQGLPESPEIDEVVDQENYENYVDTYAQFVGAEVCLSDEQWRK